MIKVMIVDDSDFDREKMVRFLRSSKIQEFEFHCLESAEQLDQVAQEWTPDIIILDLYLPGLGGMDLLRIQNEKLGKAQYPIIIATGTGNEATAVEAMKLGALDYIVKEGLNSFKLEAVVMRALERSLLEQKIQKQNDLISISQKRLQLAMESANMGAWEWDTQTNLIYWDNQTAQIMGIPETLVPRPFAEFIANVNPQFVVESFKRHSSVETYKEYNYVFPVVHKDGSIHWVKNYGKADESFYENGESIRFNGTSLDVTDQHLYKELQASILSVSRTDVLSLILEKELREQFVSTLSHDLRNPLAAAKMSADMLIRSSQGLPIIKSLNRIVVSLNRVDHMIQDLLDANRIGAGQSLPLSKTECDLNEIINDCLFSLRLDFGERFIFKFNDPVIGYWDKFGILRVFENLLTNAVKYGIADTEITITVQETITDIDVSFNNKSVGLTEAEQEKVFKPFHRTNSADNSNVRGWGLGLTIVKGITEAHGGTVSVSSIINEDVTFTVRLPKNHVPSL